MHLLIPTPTIHIQIIGIPEEIDHLSQAVTMLLFLWGSSLIAMFHLVATSHSSSSNSNTSSSTAGNTTPLTLYKLLKRHYTTSSYFDIINLIKQNMIPFLQSG